MAEEQPQNPENVQANENAQGVPPEQQQQQQEIDFEKAYKNLEPEFTRKSQELKTLEGWKKFQEQTGISAEQALQQLEGYQQPEPYPNQQNGAYSGQLQQPSPQPQGYPQYQEPQPQFGYQPQSQGYDDPRISQMERQLNEMRRSDQANKLRQKFPQFDEVYPDVVNMADQQGLDLETAFGRVLVQRYDDLMGQQKQQAIEDIRKKGTKSLESSNSPGNPEDPSAQMSAEEIEAAKAMGIDPKDYIASKQGLTIKD